MNETEKRDMSDKIRLIADRILARLKMIEDACNDIQEGEYVHSSVEDIQYQTYVVSENVELLFQMANDLSPRPKVSVSQMPMDLGDGVGTDDIPF